MVGWEEGMAELGKGEGGSGGRGGGVRGTNPNNSG